MLTAMTEDDWAIVLQVFRAVRSRRGDKGRDDRKFLEALHYFTVHNITWRALSAEFGHWNSIWKRFWRLSRAGIFEAFFDALAALSESAHLVQMFDSTVARAHVSAAGAKGEQDDQALGRSRGGFSTKIHLKVDLDAQLRFLRRARPRHHPDQIRPHGLASSTSRSVATDSTGASERSRPTATGRPALRPISRSISSASPRSSSASASGLPAGRTNAIYRRGPNSASPFARTALKLYGRNSTNSIRTESGGSAAAQEEAAAPAEQTRRAAKRRMNRGSLPPHLLRRDDDRRRRQRPVRAATTLCIASARIAASGSISSRRSCACSSCVGANMPAGLRRGGRASAGAGAADRRWPADRCDNRLSAGLRSRSCARNAD